MEIKYIGMDVHKEAISIAVMNGDGKLVMEHQFAAFLASGGWLENSVPDFSDKDFSLPLG